KKYSPSNKYVTSIETDGNVVYVNRVKKKNGSYTKTSTDSIMTQLISENSTYYVDSTSVKKFLKQNYLHLPSGAKMEEKPDFKTVELVVITENTTLRLTEKTNIKCFYIYSHGALIGKKFHCGEAVSTANEGMGVVIDSDGKVIWERGGQFLSKELSGISGARTGNGFSSKKACSYLLLKAMQVNIDKKDVEGDSVMQILKKHLDYVVNLSGCDVSEVLYFVSSESPVIAKIGKDHYVVLKAYTENNVKWYDPQSGETTSMSISNASKTLKEAGNVFISAV
nr:hypothetical protein [Lachnospiraceae bacterium]